MIVRLTDVLGVASGLSLTAGGWRVGLEVSRGQSGRIVFTGKDEKRAKLTLDEHGGRVVVKGKDGELKAEMRVREHGGQG